MKARSLHIKFSNEISIEDVFLSFGVGKLAKTLKKIIGDSFYCKSNSNEFKAKLEVLQTAVNKHPTYKQMTNKEKHVKYSQLLQALYYHFTYRMNEVQKDKLVLCASKDKETIHSYSQSLLYHKHFLYIAADDSITIWRNERTNYTFLTSLCAAGLDDDLKYILDKINRLRITKESVSRLINNSNSYLKFAKNNCAKIFNKFAEKNNQRIGAVSYSGNIKKEINQNHIESKNVNDTKQVSFNSNSRSIPSGKKFLDQHDLNMRRLFFQEAKNCPIYYGELIKPKGNK